MYHVFVGDRPHGVQTSSNVATPPEPTVTVVESGQGADLLIGEAGADVFHMDSVEASPKAVRTPLRASASAISSVSAASRCRALTLLDVALGRRCADNGKAYGVWQWAEARCAPTSTATARPTSR